MIGTALRYRSHEAALLKTRARQISFPSNLVQQMKEGHLNDKSYFDEDPNDFRAERIPLFNVE